MWKNGYYSWRKLEKTGENRKKKDPMAKNAASSRKFLSLFIIIIAFVLFGGFTLLWLQVRASRSPVSDPLPVPVRLEEPKIADLSRDYRVSGHIESARMVTLLPKTEGSLDRLSVSMGEQVSEGAVLAEIDPEPYRLTLERAEANLAGASSVFRRVEQLYLADSVSAQKYDEAKTAFEAARSSRDLAKLQWENSRVKSPFTGTVLQLHAEEGDLVSPGRPLLTLADISRLEVNASVPEIFYPRFMEAPHQIGISIRVPSFQERTFSGTIKHVAPSIDPRSRSFQVTVDIDPGDEPLRPGMFVYITFLLETRKAVYSLPHKALLSGALLWHVEGGEARKIEFSPEFSGAHRFMLDPELASRFYIVEGHHFLREGQTVKVLEQ